MDGRGEGPRYVNVGGGTRIEVRRNPGATWTGGGHGAPARVGCSVKPGTGRARALNVVGNPIVGDGFIEGIGPEWRGARTRWKQQRLRCRGVCARGDSARALNVHLVFADPPIVAHDAGTT